MDGDLRVAVIGLGRMGSSIASRVLAAGFPLVVYNRSRDKAVPLHDRGATVAASGRAAAESADVVITSLMDDASVEAAAAGADGFVAGLRPGAIHLGTTTISAEATRRLARQCAERGARSLAGPVLGRPDAAARGELAVFIAGDAGAIERVRPVVASYAARIIPVGPEPAAAARAKLLANYILVTIIDVMGQAYAFGEKAGLPEELVAGMIEALIPHKGLQGYSQRIRERRYDEPGFTLHGILKDLALILDTAAEAAAPLANAGPIRDRVLTAMAHGMGDRDASALAEASRIAAGLR